MFQPPEQVNALSSKGNNTSRNPAGNQGFEFLPTATVVTLAICSLFFC